MKEPSLLFQVITLPLIGYLFISVLLFTSVVEFPIGSPSTFVPTETPAVLVITATPEPPLTPMTAVTFTHTPVPAKAPPTPPPEPTYSSSLPYTPEQKAHERLVALNMQTMMKTQQPAFHWECEYKEVSNRKFYAVVYCDAVTEGYETKWTETPPAQAALLRFFFTTGIGAVRTRGILDLGNGKAKFAECAILEEIACIEEDIPMYEGIGLLLELREQYLSY